MVAKEKQNELTNEDKETYGKLYDTLKKQFPTLESDSKYAKFVVFSEKFNGRLFNAMVVLLKKWNSPIVSDLRWNRGVMNFINFIFLFHEQNKEALSTVVALLEQAGMNEAAKYYRKQALISFPETFA